MSERFGVFRVTEEQMAARSAKYRLEPSIPVQFLIKKGLLIPPVFDWGCGKGADLDFMEKSGISAAGWDPVHKPSYPPSIYEQNSFNTVYCGYVLNTIPNPENRINLLSDIYGFLPKGGRLVISVRVKREVEKNKSAKCKKYWDGYVSERGSFIKGYELPEILELMGLFFEEPTVISRRPLIIKGDKT